VSDQDVVAKVGDLMRTLDDVKRYKELAYAMVDFGAIMVVAVIAVIGVTMFQSSVYIVSGFPTSNNGGAYLLFGTPFPSNILVFFGELIILFLGLILGVYRVDKRVRLTKVGEWKETLEEGAPGAIKILSNMEWDSLLGTVSVARVAYLFYSIIKVIGYFLLVSVILTFVSVFTLFSVPATLGYSSIPFISLIIVLLFTKNSLTEGFRKLRSLDSLFWDLRWFASEFKRADFNQT